MFVEKLGTDSEHYGNPLNCPVEYVPLAMLVITCIHAKGLPLVLLATCLNQNSPGFLIS